MDQRLRSVRRARRQRSSRLSGFIITWDVDSRDTAMCTRVRHFVFGRTVVVGAKTYRYPGFVEQDGVRYIGQSVRFVVSPRLSELRGFLRQNHVAHVTMEANLGPVLAQLSQR